MNTSPQQEVAILIVDDDEVDISALKRAFKKVGIVSPITIANDGTEAIEILRKGIVNRPFIILLDINMPRMNGHEVLEVIRGDSILCDCTVFMLSSSNSIEDLKNAYRKQVAGYFTKDSSTESYLKMAELLKSYCNVVQLPPDDH